MKKFWLYAAFISFVLPSLALAHPGRTDSSGCHTCRTNCPDWGLSTGEYHCHNAKALPQPEEPIRSHYGEGGTGTTEPWPEYKAPEPVQVEVPAAVPVVEEPPVELPVEETTSTSNTPGISLPVQEITPPATKVFWLVRFLRFIF